MSTKISPIRVGAAIKSLRNNDFDAYSAIYEVVDNSIQAESKEIRIKFEMDTLGSQRVPRPIAIAFGDDGHGMDSKTLQHCLAIGYSNRYDDRKGIGRFGVGMTMGAINVCNKIEVYSRAKQGNWNYTLLDISGIDNDVEPSLSPIEQRDLPAKYKDLVGDHGTLVIWTNIDRIDSEFKVEEIKHHLGRIYRKFIGEEIIENGKIKKNNNQRKIFVADNSNNELIASHDPLYVTKNSKFPDDERAVLQPEHSFEHNVHDVDRPNSGERKGKIIIRTSILPESWRLKKDNAGIPGYGGTSKHSAERRIPYNEGFSILRNGREVYYGPIPRFSPVAKPLDRFWGCEIDFDSVLDYWFSVKNIKVGARPLKDLRDILEKKLNPTILNNFRKTIKEAADAEEQKENEENKGPINSHKTVEETLTPITAPMQSTDTKDHIKENIENRSKDISDNPDEQADYVKAVTDPSIVYKIIHDYKARSDGTFIDVLDDVGKKVIHYNMQHPFFVEINRRISEIESMAIDPQKSDLQKASKALRADIDRLLYAYAEGQYDLDDLTRMQSVKDTVEEHMLKWSHHLRKSYKV